jgi:hypothetical protein
MVCVYDCVPSYCGESERGFGEDPVEKSSGKQWRSGELEAVEKSSGEKQCKALKQWRKAVEKGVR